MHREESVEEFAARRMAEFAKNDHLGHAALAGSKAREAIANGDHDLAWRFLNEQKQHYLLHASRCNFTKAQTLALDAAVSQPMAKILQLEGKHFDALVHIIYWVATSTKETKGQQQKLSSYFKKCNFKDKKLSDVQDLVASYKSDPDFIRIRDIIGSWRD